MGAVDLTRDVLDEWYTYFHQCSECRRCSVFCPYGIDTAEVTMAAREIMASIGMGQKVHQRDHRQGTPHWQQPGNSRARAGKHAGRPGRRYQGRDRCGCEVSAERERGRSAADYPVRRLLLRAPC
ncbi:hypothetical protein [Candidatus Aalborgicola defluviihabitans]|uniref:hypothetical protein n=1 Tax=Candidatus Aalborgicola defluviihabitans TaxID=3386187 RepID=UPI0039B8FB45